MGQKEYLEVLDRVVKLWVDANYPEGGYGWQQDSSPGHKAKATQAWCGKNFVDLWPSHLWPQSSPACSPLDYAVRGMVERRACRTAT